MGFRKVATKIYLYNPWRTEDAAQPTKNRFTEADVPPPQVIHVVHLRLLDRLQDKIRKAEQLWNQQMIEEGGYDSKLWRDIEQNSEAIERLKGAIAVTRWVLGTREGIDLELRGHLDMTKLPKEMRFENEQPDSKASPELYRLAFGAEELL